MFKPTKRLSLCAGALTLLAIAGATPAAAQFGARNVQLLIGVAPGGGYDLWGRAVARHLGKHLPGKPTVVPQNMPGAGSVNAATHIYNVAPKDGTVIGIIASEAPLAPLLFEGAQFDPTKLSWIGSPSTAISVCIASNTAKVKSAKDLFEHELIMGDTGVGTGAHSLPNALNGLLGTKFKLIGGFRSSTTVMLAIEQGEVDGMCMSYDSLMTIRGDWVRSGKVVILFQGGPASKPELKDVPYGVDLARNAEERLALEFLYAGQGIGRPFIAPPDLPADKLKALRDGFDATMTDPEFLEDAGKQKFEIDPISGVQLEALIKKIYATPKSIVDRVGKLIK